MSGPELLARQIQRLSAQAIGARQPDLAGLIAAWADIVGPQWAGRCTPVAFRPGRGGQPGMMDLAVSAGEALLVQHETPVLLGRINAYLGHMAVKGFRLQSAESEPIPYRRADKKLDPVAVDGVDDPELANLLGRLGAALRDSGKNK